MSDKRDNYMIPLDLYQRNEAIFFKLVINTKKNSDVFKFEGDSQILKEMDIIFRSTPKIVFLAHFFKNEAVQLLYCNFK